MPDTTRTARLPAWPVTHSLDRAILVQWAHTVGSQGTPPVSAAALPQAPGVYRFRDRAGRVLYLGRAVSLRRRVLSYRGDLGDRAHLAPMVARITWVEAVTCDSAHEAAWLERNLLEHRRPPWNRAPGGQEAEVWIRLSASPRRPGLTVVRQPAPGDFGPYLGGQKVRDAVSGLGRVLPLGYAADAQPGTERDMARVRGTSPAARSGLARAIAAVLDRDQAAVAALRAELTARRDTAAAALAFEFAGRLPGRARGAGLGDRGAEGHPGSGRRRRMRLGRQRPCLVRDPRRADARLAAAPLRGGRRPPHLTRAARWARLRPLANAELAARLRSPRAELGGAAQVRWQKLNQLPESSRSSALIP